jgi:hypothetical protein
MFYSTIRKVVLWGALMLFTISIYSQGCVAIRSGCGANVGGGSLLSKGSIQIASNFRYFHSYKHFRGTHEETYRVEEGSEVINDSYFFDALFSYGLSERLAVNVAIPFVYHQRSSMYEHGGNPREDDAETPENEFWQGDRHTTGSSGLSDIRFGISYWMLDPQVHQNANFTLGLGMKLRSGDYMAQDLFYNQGDSKDQTITSGIDQSIQPGDGGIGATIDLQGYYSLNNNVLITSSLFYLINPQEKYSLEARGRDREYSIPDQYAARAGALLMLPVHGLFFYGGGRIEGIPANDLIGGSDGFRRPGYVVSLEPGLTYILRRFAANLSMPIAVERNRVQSYTDIQSTKSTGTYRHGDAAFADYLLNVGLSWSFNKTIKSYNWQQLGDDSGL